MTSFALRHQFVDMSSMITLFVQFSEQKHALNMTAAFINNAIGLYILQRRSAVAMLKALSGPEEPFKARTEAPYR